MSAAENPAFDATIRSQRKAADPKNSAFVSANAGSGKTRVLTDRVARLLLAGAPPQKILCITFTKAAAAEMATRLFRMLGEWALAEDGALNKALNALRGEDKEKRPPDELAAARRLFARAIETPGGLKIQTIHSFCENVLKRFPLEAGAAPGFSVVEEGDARTLASAAVERVFTARADSDIARAAGRLAARFAPDRLQPLFIDGAVSRLKLARALDAAGGWQGLEDDLARRLGVETSADAAALRDQFLARLKRAELGRAHAAIMQSGSNARKFAGKPLAALLEANDAAEKWRALCALFLTGGEPRKQLGDKKTDEADAWARPFLSGLQSAFVEANDRIKAAVAFQDTAAYLRLVRAIWSAYDAMKAARAMLDYDDLIEKTRALFADRESAAWVLFKLDQGLDHILLDEAQDTSPAQWAVIEGPLREFFAGEGAREAQRTFFAVGDQKQSIYSFQGADASLFKEKRESLGKEIAAIAPYVDEPLTLSFRTTAPVLEFVDALFAEDGAREGLWEDSLSHGVHRRGAAGLVELWPLTPRPKETDENPWDAPVDSTPPVNPVRTLAESVAGQIAGWLANGEKLASAERPVRPGDIMILVQSRGPLFHEAIKALGRAGVPVAGADRLKLLEDAAVEDILAYARSVLLDTDDLSLAEVLKSPFFGFDDDDLMALAPNRRGSLWRALTGRAAERERWTAAAEAIRNARKAAFKEGAYAFLVHILERGAPSGRSRLYARLGEASRETIDELLRQALDYELKAPRSLQGFLVWLGERAGEIKRELDQTSGAVRVMTAHGAKGLEAPIVFLLDAHRPPNTRKVGPLFDLADETAAAPAISGAFALSAGAGEECAPLKAARERAKRLQYEEYRRLLYVAATRARDRLYICGVELGNQKDPGSKAVAVKSWHALSVDAFERLGHAESAPHPVWAGAIRRITCSQTGKVEEEKEGTQLSAAPAPAWLRAPAAPEVAPRRIAPSALADEAEAISEPAAFSPARAYAPFLRGRTLHRLLELLPGLDAAQRAVAAGRLLARLAAEVDEEERAAWREEALAVLADPQFAPVFAPASRAEVAIAGAPRGARPGLIISGQIDRLAVTGSEVLVVDYKTNRPPPRRAEDIAPAYIAQLAAYRALLQEIYPAHQIRTALLWTYEARLTAIPAVLLDHAFARHLA
jgi:ATP-dependent helicase/nuclease subunit A